MFTGLELHHRPLPFATSLHTRAFTLGGELVVYASPGLEDPGHIRAQYLNHWHEATFGGGFVDAPLIIHDEDAPRVECHRATFNERTTDGDLELIPIPGHTPGATAFLWDSGDQRFLFTGDSIYLVTASWLAAVLDDSERSAYIDSLELLRDLEFDVLVPWATKGDWWAPAAASSSTR